MVNVRTGIRLGRYAAPVILAAASARAAAQPARGSVSIAGGSATDVVGTTSRALTVAPTLEIDVDPRLSLGVSASGTRYDGRQWSIGGQAAAAARLPITRWAALTLNASAGATTTSYDFSYTSATALPAVELAAGPVAAFVGAAGAAATTRAVRATATPGGLFGGTPLTSRSVIATSRGARGAVFGANLRFADRGDDGGDERGMIGVRREQSVVDTTPTVDHSALLALSAGRVGVAASFGVRREPGTSTTFGSGTASLVVNSAVSVELAAGSYAADRLVGTPAGRFLTFGLSLRTGRFGPRPQAAEGIPAPAAGMTRVALRAPNARRVDVAGDFSGWKTIAASRAPNGIWFVDLRLPPGQYRYAFRVDGTTWTVPGGTAAVDDGFGGKSAWLTVASSPGGTPR